MKEIYFIIDNVKYILLHENGRLKICKNVNDKIESLSIDEYERIKKLYDDAHSGNLYYKTVNTTEELIFENPNLYKNEVFSNFNPDSEGLKSTINHILTCVLSHIPQYLRNPFFSNLQNIKIEYSDNLGPKTRGVYNPQYNIMFFNKKYFDEVRAKKKPEELNAALIVTLIHELYHVASASYIIYDGNKLKYISGFCDAKTGVEYSAITEGFTQLLTWITVPSDTYIKADGSSVYFEELFIAGQINVLMDDHLSHGYFANDIEFIKEHLNYFHKDRESIDTLFDVFEMYFCIKEEASEENLLASVQMILLSCLESKIKHMLSDKFHNQEKEVIELIDKYGLYLFKGLNGKNKKLEESVKEFNRIKDYYLKYLGMRRINSGSSNNETHVRKVS